MLPSAPNESMHTFGRYDKSTSVFGTWEPMSALGRSLTKTPKSAGGNEKEAG